MRYYITKRPIAPGTYPAYYKVTTIHSFNEKTFCEDIGREAWGYVDFESDIPDYIAENYELTKSGVKRWYGVTSWFNDKGHSGAAISTVQDSEEKPKNTATHTLSRDIYLDWFSSHEAALEHAKKARNA